MIFSQEKISLKKLFCKFHGLIRTMEFPHVTLEKDRYKWRERANHKQNKEIERQMGETEREEKKLGDN